MLGQLTAKQVEVLDLLVRHLTTKEIARELNLAPNTVDQRITAVREKWGLPNRKATVRQYTELQELCGKTTYGPPRLDEDTPAGESVDDAQPADQVLGPPEAVPTDPDRVVVPAPEPSFMLQHSDIQFGRLGRVALALFFAFVIAATLALSLWIAEAMGHWL